MATIETYEAYGVRVPARRLLERFNELPNDLKEKGFAALRDARDVNSEVVLHVGERTVAESIASLLSDEEEVWIKGSRDMYKVTIRGGVVESCSCPDYVYRRADEGEFCKHMASVYHNPSLYNVSGYIKSIKT